MDAKRGTSPPNPNPSRPAGSSSQLAGSSAAPESSAPETSKAMLQAFYFLRALSRVRGVTPVRRRTRTIRRAAYSSMARAANSPRRVWSQVLLRQARAHRSTTTTALSRRTVPVRRRVGASPVPAPLPGRRARSSGGTAAGETSSAAASRLLIPPPRQVGEPSRSDALRRLVPGGAGMEYCSLLEETADYVRCLRAQVELMQGLADLFSCQ